MPIALPSMPMFANLRRWYAQRTPRERRSIAAAIALSTAAIAWWAIWQPMVQDIARMHGQAVHAKEALAEAQRFADEFPGLARTRRPLPATPLRADVEQVVATTLGRPAGLAIDTQEQRVRVTLPAVPFDSLTLLLEALQREALIQAAEVRLTARVEPGSVRAELLLAR
jgi:type II secretory pathway component PulM